MNRIKLKLSDITLLDRQRQDLGDIQSLADSLKQYGLIQPIVVTQDNRLIAGGRRYAAATLLNWESIDVVYRETLTEDELFELELEENIRRKDFTWQERVLNIATIHEHKVRRWILEGKEGKWGQKQTSEALGLDSLCTVNYSLQIAKKLRSDETKSSPFWKCDSMMEAYRLILREQEDKINAELAKRQLEAQFTLDMDETVVDTTPAFEEPPMPSGVVVTDDIAMLRQTPYLSLQPEQAKALYLANPLNPPEKFDEYYLAKLESLRAPKDEWFTISNILHKGDSIKYMQENAGCFDHVITDIPYGIDMQMLNQQNPHGGMKDIDIILEEHKVDYNMQLIADFFPAAFAALKPDGFCITWCDQMLWQYMYDHAIKAGFKVQRWPITWVKTHTCLNQSAQYNFTKSTEIAIVCRKGKATIVTPQSRCTIEAGRDELCEQLGHPFAKPRKIWEFLANAVSIEGQLILEPFAGRGSGVISMLGIKRNVVGVELNTEHYNALLENVKLLHFLPKNPNMKFR